MPEPRPAAAAAGRPAVLARARAALAAGGLVLTGHLGAGRSTLLSALAEECAASGHRVLRCAPARSDRRLPHLGLIDLMAQVRDEELDHLWDPERALLDGVLRRGAGTARPEGGEQLLTLHLALLRVFTELARPCPLLLVVDDAQWLDEPSADALSFVARRSTGGRLAVAAAVRTDPGAGAVHPRPQAAGTAPPHDADVGRHGESPDAVDRAVRLCPGPATTLAVPPMTEPEIAEVLAAHGMRWPRQMAARVRRAAGGNPRFALELARTCQDDGSPVWGRPLTPASVPPLPEALRPYLHDWLAALGAAARRTLLAAGAAAYPTAALLRRAGFAGAADDLREAVRLGLVAPVGDGPVRFTQPLTAVLLYEEAGAEERARVHRALADAATDPVERAQQLASLATGEDAALAALLSEAAAIARRRGARANAAQLGLSAAELTPGTGADSVDRLLTAAEDALAAGDYPLVRRLAHHALRDCRNPADRIRAWMAIIDSSGQAVAEVANVLRYALRDAECCPDLLAQVHYRLAWQAWVAEGSAVRAHPHAVRAARLSREADDWRTHQLGLTLQAAVEFYLGLPEAEDTLRAALTSRADHRALYDHNGPAFVRSRRHLLHDRLDDARAEMRALVYTVRTRGSTESLSQCLASLALVEVHRGRCARALDLAAQSLDVAARAGFSQGPAWHALAVARAAGGDPGEALVAAEQARRHAEDDADRLFLPRALHAEGHVRLVAGESGAALPVLRRVRDLELAQGQGDPAIRRWHSDLAEALVLEGCGVDADELLEQTWKQAVRLGRQGVLATLRRPRALLLEAEGDAEAAVHQLRLAAEQLRELGYPLEEGRTRLALGLLCLRTDDQSGARRELAATHALFTRARAWPWLALTRAAQDQPAPRGTGGPPPATAAVDLDLLTDAERRVAQRVAEGASNREIAAELVVSVKTVEAALTRAYRKLGVRSRVDLTRVVLSLSPARAAPRRARC
ncbi:LuxR family transcriptional regulator [Streptomyces sp. L2]|uniref:LuxR C-terminal-related transcriptional regulator n=1 Tax=Streptomyces sp. L2 TaxID=2162665 RepID=UPI0013E929E0|nr:LuxR family transcriptional regulator [Streptomyces sp. L2]